MADRDSEIEALTVRLNRVEVRVWFLMVALGLVGLGVSAFGFAVAILLRPGANVAIDRSGDPLPLRPTLDPSIKIGDEVVLMLSGTIGDTMDARTTYIRGVNATDWHDYRRFAIARDFEGLNQLKEAGKVLFLEQGTRAKVLAIDPHGYNLRIDKGEAWVLTENVRFANIR
jgi:hypothetical protein